MREKTILPGSTLGVLGGGQLGRMFAIAAQQMGYKVIAYTPEPNSPASQVCEKVFCAGFDDTKALTEFAQSVSVVTLEFENIPTTAVEIVQQHTEVRPGLQVLSLSQHRLKEKEYLREKKFPVVPFHSVKSIGDLKDGLALVGTPAVLKTAGMGYDGKGQQLINDVNQSEEAFKALNGQDGVVEQFINFEKEISVIGARSLTGDFVAYGPIENIHRNHILDISLAPARISWTLGEEAIDITSSIMQGLNMVGLLCVEFFVSPEETLMVNELAPRPHNSGHFSLEASPCSQFEQLVRCITGLPLGTTETEKGVAMANLLGDIWANGEPDWASALALPDVHLHLYGKQEPRPGRKMGHLTACAKWADEAVERVQAARELLTQVLV